MVELFRAIGFDIADESDYNRLAEVAGERGERTHIRRRGATLHGRCWQLGEGIEVWTVLREAGGDLQYADCRPGFRPKLSQSLGPWELIEYDEDGEAVVEGRLVRAAAPVSFELQNLTEVGGETFEHPHLSVALAGLAYDLRPARPEAAFGVVPSHRSGSVPPPEGSDYIATGRVSRSSALRNPHTNVDLLWLHLDVGGAPLEVIGRAENFESVPRPGDVVEAEVWLQGYVLNADAVRARYEGIDPEWDRSDAWHLLRRGN